MSLSDLRLDERYRRDRNSLLKQFYMPCLRNSRKLWRAAGYFSGSIIENQASDLLDFAGRGGTMRIVTSPHLTTNDVEELRRGYRAREEIISAALQRTLDSELSDNQDSDLGVLGYLVARSILDLKIAMVERNDGSLGLYHEKFGIFFDGEDQFVSFEGSANESLNGLDSNFESISVFCSWDPKVSSRASSYITDFETLWDNTTEGLAIYDFPSAVKQRLIEAYHRTRVEAKETSTLPMSIGYGIPCLPSSVKLRDYQLKAVEAWAHANGQGILEMATGTGKTITALHAVATLAQKLHAAGKSLAVVIACPFKNLVDQWATEAASFGILPIRCYEGRSTWEGRARETMSAVRHENLPFALFITTNDTLRGDSFQELLRTAPINTMFVADEVHNCGAELNARALPPNVRLRLGLSATPERWFDELGTSRIVSYFGNVVFRLGLQEAISMGALTPYRYHPIIVRIEVDEMNFYAELSRRISRAAAAASAEDSSLDDSMPFKLLLIQRARLLNGARNKMSALRESLTPYKDSQFNLVYCAEGRPDNTEDTDNDDSSIERALAIVGNDLGMHCDTYTAQTSNDERDHLLKRFRSGRLQALLAMRCLDEGIDIPAVQRGFLLASSSNPRQFIQRRGRLLRRAPNKERAEIFDFIVVPPSPTELANDLFAIERRLVGGELRRVSEFAGLAQNAGECLAALRPVRKEYDIFDVA